jgi:hypothetical protein
VSSRGSSRAIDVTPSASRLTTSLRDIGYDFTTALADLVDNSVSAGATRVDIQIEFDGPDSHIFIADDGQGMTANALNEALRFGTRRIYADGQLGRFGLGLKTASLSQCRRMTVLTRSAPDARTMHVRTLDIDHIAESDRWEVLRTCSRMSRLLASSWLAERSGTVVVWEHLDRLLPEKRQDGTHTARRFAGLAEKAREYLGMVFHRFIEDTTDAVLTIMVNGTKVEAWNPFAPLESQRIEMPERVFELVADDSTHEVIYTPCVLPQKHQFSSLGEFDRMSGPLKWNRQQGLYIYRANRLIQAGGWCGIRAIDEHTKLGRAALDFGTALDDVFNINVAKMRVNLPAQLRPQLERPINELCHIADSVYRSDPAERVRSAAGSRRGNDDLLVAIRAAAMELGESKTLKKILKVVESRSPQLLLD